MRVLGVDCGSQATGYGLIESDGRAHSALEFGTLRWSRTSTTTFAERLDEVHRALTRLLLQHRPETVAIEDVFYAQNVRSAFKLAHVRGIAMQAAAAQGIAVAEYAPLAVKNAVTGYGRAEKSQVQHMICSLLRLETPPDSLDASDALAVALCHIQTAGSPLTRAKSARATR